MIFGLLKSFALKIITNWKVALVVIFSIASLWAGNKGFNLYKELKAYREAKPDTVRVVESVTVTLHDTTYRYIKGRTDTVKIDLSSLTRAQLEEAAQPFSISFPVTVTDDQNQVAISFNMNQTSIPLRHEVDGLSFTNIRSTYPKETVTVTKIAMEPYKPHFVDLFISGDIGGAFGRKGIAGMVRSGLDINVFGVQLSAGIGAGFQASKVYGIWSTGLKISTR